MKLAGLTWWRNNYGSILQAYALQEVFKQYEGIEYEILCQYGKKIVSVDNLYDKIKRIGIRKTVERLIWKFGLRGVRRRNQRIQDFVDQRLNVSQKQYNKVNIAEANEQYDGFVCGSDQIWNPTLVPVDSMYWLGFAEQSKLKFSYAPSIGVEQISKEQEMIIRSNLASFDGISCREDVGTRFLNRILSEERCVTVLDPTLLVDRKLWDELSLKRKYQGKYLFAYMLRGTKKQRKWIKNLAMSRNLKIVTIPLLETKKFDPYDLKFGDIKFWDASPADFISVIRYADCVVTDSFHCMVFSCLYHRDFFSLPKLGKAQMNRISDFQSMLSISERIVTDDMSLDEIGRIPDIDWKQVDGIIREKRSISEKYLVNVLGNWKK